MIRFIFILVSIMALSEVSFGVNLISNGNFEAKLVNNKIPGWSGVQNSSLALSSEGCQSRHGLYLNQKSPDKVIGYQSDPIAISSDSKILYCSANIRAKDVTGEGSLSLQLIVFDKSGKELGRYPLEQTKDCPDDWRKIRVSVPLPTGANHAQLNFELSKVTGEGWLDNVVLSYENFGQISVNFSGNQRVITICPSIAFGITSTQPTDIQILDFNSQVVQKVRLEAGKAITITLNKPDPGIYWITDDGGAFLDTFAVVEPVSKLPNPETSRFGVHYPIMYREPSWHDAEFSLYEKIGAVWLRCVATWNVDEIAPGNYDFVKRDQFLSLMERHGLKMLTTFEYTPEKYSPAYNHLDALMPYIKAYAEHYRGRLKYYEVWNEANSMPVETYVTLHKKIFETLKGVDPKVLVLQTGIANPSKQGEWGLSLLGSQFQAEILKLGLDAFTDIYNFHFYPYQWDTHTIVRQYMSVFQKYNIRKPVWVTENGYLTDINNIPQQRTQAEYLAKSAVTCLALGCDKYFWFLSLDTQAFPYGLLDGNLRPKAAFVTYGVLANLLNDAVYAGQMKGGPAGMVGYKFTKGTKTVMALWSKGSPVSISASQLNLPTGESTLIDLMGRKQSVQSTTKGISLKTPVFIICDRP